MIFYVFYRWCLHFSPSSYLQVGGRICAYEFVSWFSLKVHILFLIGSVHYHCGVPFIAGNMMMSSFPLSLLSAYSSLIGILSLEGFEIRSLCATSRRWCHLYFLAVETARFGPLYITVSVMSSVCLEMLWTSGQSSDRGVVSASFVLWVVVRMYKLCYILFLLAVWI